MTCFACWAVRSEAQNSDYQTGKIISIEKLPASSSPSTGTDTPLAAGTNGYNLSIQIDGSVYVCRAKMPNGSDLDWAQGKEVQSKVKGKAMYLKRNDGSVAKLSIISTKKAE